MNLQRIIMIFLYVALSAVLRENGSQHRMSLYKSAEGSVKAVFINVFSGDFQICMAGYASELLVFVAAYPVCILHVCQFILAFIISCCTDFGMSPVFSDTVFFFLNPSADFFRP